MKTHYLCVMNIPLGPYALHWSSGKDAALALQTLLVQGFPPPVCLITTYQQSTQRVSMHGTGLDLVEQQAQRLGVPLRAIELPDLPDNQAYQKQMDMHYQALAQEGVKAIVFGDIFLEELRAFRESQLTPHGLEAVFPLWHQNTASLAQQIGPGKIRAKINCIMRNRLPEICLGLDLEDALPHFPPNADPCGENGEFHSFVYDMPAFSSPIAMGLGQKVMREYPAPNAHLEPVRMQFIDLLPLSASQQNP